MFRLWKKLIRLQSVMKVLNKSVTEEIRKIQVCRDKMDQAQQLLQSDIMNPEHCRMVKYWAEELLKQTELEEKVLKQKANIDWIQLGDGNNAYFYANLKAKNKQTTILSLKNQQGMIVTDYKDLEKEVLQFYRSLIGTE